VDGKNAKQELIQKEIYAFLDAMMALYYMVIPTENVMEGNGQGIRAIVVS